MRTPAIVLALSLGLLAACDRGDDRPRPAAAGSSAAPAAGATTPGNDAAKPQTPANMGTPSSAEKAEGRNPQQGQVDPKQKEQHRDFKHPETGGK